MEQYIINEQIINEINWEIENTIAEIIYDKINSKRIMEIGDDDFVAYPIKTVLKRHPKLLDHLFNYKNNRLNGDPAQIMKDAGCFSSGEQLLIKVALDFWDGSGNALMRDVYQILDSNNFKNVFSAMKAIRNSN